MEMDRYVFAMVNDIYFEEELRYLREEGERFAQMYPQRARYLNLDSIKGESIRIKRLFEGFAFLSAKIKRRLDDGFPELTEGLVEMLWPRLLEPVPPMCIVELTPRSGMLQHSCTIHKGTEMLTAPDSVVRCKFSTTHDVIMNPLILDKTEYTAGVSGKDMLTLVFKIDPGISLESLRIEPLRLYIRADLTSALRIRKSLLHDVEDVVVRDNLGRTAQLVPKDTFVEGGFAELDDLFPERQNINRPLSLIRDYFLFPERFLFVDIFGLDFLPLDAQPFSTLFLDVRFDRKITGGAILTKSCLKLYCVPAINIFRRDAEPLYIDGEKNEYDIISDVERPTCYAIRSVESVTGIDAVTGVRRVYSKFRKPGTQRTYSLHRERQPDGDMRIKLSMNGQQTENGRIIREMLHIETWQTNGTMASKAAIGGGLCKPTPNFPDFITFKNITTPNNPIYPPDSDDYLWIFISHLSNTYSDFNDVEKLKLFLYAYDWIGMSQRNGISSGVDAWEKRPEVEAILSVAFKPIDLAVDRAVIRGTEMNVTVDENTATEERLFLLGTVLARALSCMASINTFLRFVFTMSASGKTFEWRCQAGERMV